MIFSKFLNYVSLTAKTRQVLTLFNNVYKIYLTKEKRRKNKLILQTVQDAMTYPASILRTPLPTLIVCFS